jgi:beta-lactamase regulating signal transducer with metallopeptidase domain
MTFLVVSALRVSIILFAALCLLRLMRRRSAALRHWVLSVAVLAAIAAPIITLLVPAWEVRVVPPHPWNVKSSATPPVAVPVPSVIISTTQSVATAQTPLWPRVALALWLTGVAIGTVVLALGISRLHRLIAESGPLTNGGWIRASAAISKQYRLRRNTWLLETAGPSVLVTCGLFRPRILIPSGTADWTETRIVSVLRHELAHVCRFDWPLQMAAQTMRALLWFNPLAWIVCERLRFESECACDDLAISAGIDSATYANDLLAVARELNGQPDAWSAAIGMAERSSLQRRFVAMLDPSTNRQPLTSRIRIAIIAAVMGLVLPLSVIKAAMPNEVLELQPAPPMLEPRISEPSPTPQATSSRLIGIVSDNAGNPLAGATVFVSDAFTGEQIGRIDVSRKNRETAESELNNEQNRFDQGTSTLRLVLEAQRRLTQARADELDVAMSVFGGTPNAKITQTDPSGAFVVSGLQPGRYSVRVFSSRVGFSAITNVDVRPGQDLRQDFRIDMAQQRNASLPPAPAPLPGVETTITTRLDLPTVESNSMRLIYTPPRVLHKVDILFPMEAKQVRFQGTEVVRAMIRTDGSLLVQEVLSSLDSAFLDICRRQISEGRWPDAPYATAAACPEHIGFDDATTQALSQWRFAPAVREGVPVTTILNIKVDFILY